MKWQISYLAIKEEFRKLGVVLIAGGIIGRAFEHKIDMATAITAILGGVALILLGAVQRARYTK